MVLATDIIPVADGISVWQTFDPAVKADLWSSAVGTPVGLVLIDPIRLERTALRDLTSRVKVAGIVVSNENHERATAHFVDLFHPPVFAHGAVADALCLPHLVPVIDKSEIVPDLTAIHLEGAPTGEIALIHAENGGTLVVGDALINFEPYGFTFLPAKYCRDIKLMQRSLAKLLAYQFERILFAHGTPIVRAGRSRFEQLLSGKS
ncbi:MAG TPA: hypothetical protein VJ063_07885 [Verrucomicrobiae bacterium]|nr:hypothetical protein [Verrucomicrobiae bacterium]